MRRLHVTWFEKWHEDISSALQELPEKDNCPHELYRILIQNPGPARKRTAIVTENGAPVAVAGLRKLSRTRWEPVTQWIAPGMVIPAKPDYLIPALEALGVDVFVSWWNMDSPPPPSRDMRDLVSTPVYGIRCSDNYEQHWRQSSHYKSVSKARNHCKDFMLAVNAPGTAEWVIKNWDAKWHNTPESESLSLLDRIVASDYLESRQKRYTLSLFDQEKLICGATSMVDQNDLVAGVIYRDPEYDRHGVGVRIIELVFTFAVERGFDALNIGGGHDYKQRWAPQMGERWQFDICPGPLYRAKQIISFGRKMQEKIAHGVHDDDTLTG